MYNGHIKTGRSAVWLAYLHGVQVVGGSNPLVPTRMSERGQSPLFFYGSAIMNHNPSFQPKKSLGQNFLVDRNILSHIMDRANISKEDVVLEIGAGQGILTRELASTGCAHLHSVEIDRSLSGYLCDIPLANPGRLSLIWEDALALDYAALSPHPGKVVANIPYNITTPLIWRLLEQLPPFGTDYFLLMVQREAADRVIAPPRTKERYPLGITLELMGKATLVRNVSPRSFRPAPSVLSALLEIRLSGCYIDLPNDALWRGMLRSGFAHRRKKLLNNLLSLSPEKDWKTLFHTGGICENARAEELTGDDWIGLWRSAKENGG